MKCSQAPINRNQIQEPETGALLEPTLSVHVHMCRHVHVPHSLSVLTGLLQWNMVVSSSQAFYVKHSLPEKDLHSSLYITGLHWLPGSPLRYLTVNGGRGVVTPIRNMAAPRRAMLFRTMGGVPRRLDNLTEVYQMDPLYKWYFFQMTLFPGSGFINCSEGLHVHLKNDYSPYTPSLFGESTEVIESQDNYWV